MSTRNSIALAMTGASGAAYGLRLLECLVKAGEQVHLMISRPAQIVIAMETDIKLSGTPSEMQQQLSSRYGANEGQLYVWGKDQWGSPVASGSGAPRAMVVCPCTSAFLSAAAHGGSADLMERAADVAIKERRKLILVHRETPLSAIHLENALKLAHLGATILPANPGFYQNPETIDDLVDFVVARILDHLDIEHELLPRWGEK
ncbi:aromatic acid decarboxylase [Candidatus Tenderia electrophaga]|jgi:4-hydroxy-3-polyprenylbenzoate decarboxylase|uniref:Flavin prenyltransferase UbiX n=1 Tax=Candidatus Tenderia electrophaga TaxID=1748243 RepID=A0A0S2TGA6_9GAMM|nr:aromatic acid decarboxylase [Candidatus Tenderia electrophaga]